LKFEEFGFDPKLLEAIRVNSFETATPIQEQTIPAILEGKDILASAQTGTGKTAAFLLPIIHKIQTFHHDKHIKALVIVPTRELAMQIDQHMEGLSYFTDVSSIAVYGGTDGAAFTREKQALTEGADMVICTPGRMIAHLNQGYVKMGDLKFLILDEADRMLDMGFYDDIMKILSYLPGNRQNLLFSATMPEKIRIMAKKVLHQPEEINIALGIPVEKIVQEAYIVYDKQKIPLVSHILHSKNLNSVLIFCSTKSATKQLSQELKKAHFSAEAIHSDLEQDEREKVLSRFKSRELKTLVATDILSRGIDIENIDLIINFDVPHDAEDYIHRIGRTARAESEGLAITLVNEKEQRKFLRIEDLLGKPVAKVQVPAQFGAAPAFSPGQLKKSPGIKRFSSRSKSRRPVDIGSKPRDNRSSGSRPKRAGNK
jgi:ATP-dependent RNA helicase RhlE